MMGDERYSKLWEQPLGDNNLEEAAIHAGFGVASLDAGCVVRGSSCPCGCYLR